MLIFTGFCKFSWEGNFPPMLFRQSKRMNMMNLTVEPSARGNAIVAGTLYLLLAIFSGFSMMYVDSRLYVANDAAATVGKILASESLYRLGFVCNFVGQICFLFLVHSLYTLLKPVDKILATLMVMLVIASIPVTVHNMLLKFAPILLMSGAPYLSVFEPAQLQALALLLLDLQKYGVFIAQVFWGLWLFPLGLLIIKSGTIPKVIGMLLMAGCVGYLLDCMLMFLSPSHKGIASPGIAIAALAELSLIFWLLYMGAKPTKTARRPTA